VSNLTEIEQSAAELLIYTFSHLFIRVKIRGWLVEMFLVVISISTYRVDSRLRLKSRLIVAIRHISWAQKLSKLLLSTRLCPGQIAALSINQSINQFICTVTRIYTIKRVQAGQQGHISGTNRCPI